MALKHCCTLFSTVTVYFESWLRNRYTEVMSLCLSCHLASIVLLHLFCLCHVQVVSMGLYVGEQAYLRSSWNILDGFLVFVSLIDIVVSMAGGAKILGVLRVLRLLRTLRPLRWEQSPSSCYYLFNVFECNLKLKVTVLCKLCASFIFTSSKCCS